MKSYRYKKIHHDVNFTTKKINPIFSAYFFNYARYKRGAAYDTGFFHQYVLVKGIWHMGLLFFYPSRPS